MSHPSSQTLNRYFGQYECLGKVGAGGMGSVYKARHRETKAIVALKVASRRVQSEPILAKRFQNEFEATRHLDHPHLVRALDYGKENGVPYLVLEYVAGQSLDQAVRTKGKLSQDYVLRVARHVADALEFVHERNLIHRDVKPGNILLSVNGDAKLADLGLVKKLDDVHLLTRSRTGLGTLDFASPEQFDNAKHADVRADIYSLAATLYVALTGQPPFGQGGQITILGRKLANAHTPLPTVLPEVYRCVDKAISKALQAEPERRPPTVAAFMKMLTAGVSRHDGVDTVSWREQRVNLRQTIHLHSTCQLAHQPRQGTLTAIVQDISVHGLCMRLPRRFEKGTLLEVHVPTPDRPGGIAKLLVQVRWTRAQGGNIWLVGTVFATPLSPDEVEAFCFDASPVTTML